MKNIDEQAEAVANFVNRENYVSIFDRVVTHELRPRALVFWGINGIGKTYLLHYLHQYFHRLPAGKGRISGWLSFNPFDSLIQTRQGLWYLRDQLLLKSKEIQSNKNVRLRKELKFTRFDILWAVLWQIEQHLSINNNKDFSSEERQFLETVLDQADAVVGSVVPFSGIITNLIRAASRTTAYRQKNNIYQQVQQWFLLHSKNHGAISLEKSFATQDQRVIGEWLPRAFAADLADWVAQFNTPLVLFIDGYEVLRSQTNQQSSSETPTFIQILAEELVILKANALLVIASTEPMRWSQIQSSAGKWINNPSSIWAQQTSSEDLAAFVSTNLEEYNIAYLDEVHSLTYLTQYRHMSKDEAQALYNITKGYPLALSTASDVLTGSQQDAKADLTALKISLQQFPEFSPKWQTELESWLLDKLLDNVQMRLKNLLLVAAMPRWFTEALLSFLLSNAVIQDDFRQFINYSFVEPKIRNQGYRLHAGIRDLILHSVHDEDAITEWEKKAYQWFKMMSLKQEKQKLLYQTEALYHLWHFDPVAALAELDALFEDPLTSRLDIRWSLLDTTAETEATLPPEIRIQLKLRRTEQYLLTFEQGGTKREAALHEVKDAFTIAKQYQIDDMLGTIYATQADVLLRMQHFIEALQMAKEACEVAGHTDDRNSLAHGLALRASIESLDNNEFGNTALLKQAAALFSSQFDELSPKDKHTILFILWNQAQLALRFKQWDLLERTLPQIAQLEVDSYRRTAIKQFYGEAYVQQGRIEEAITNLTEAQQFARTLRYTPGICAASGWRGLAFLKQGYSQAGWKNLHSALRVEHNILSSKEGVAKWLMYLAELVYIPQGNYEQALTALMGAYNLQTQLRHVHAERTLQSIDEIRRRVGSDEFNKLQARIDLSKSKFAPYMIGWQS